MAEWISRELTEAYGWKVAPRYIIRDHDAVYGDIFIRRLRAIGIPDRPTAPRSPWQNGYCERAIGPIRRECLALYQGHFSADFTIYMSGLRLNMLCHLARNPLRRDRADTRSRRQGAVFAVACRSVSSLPSHQAVFAVSSLAATTEI